MKKQRKSYEYSHDGVKESIIRHAKGLRIQEGWAEIIAERVATATDKWIFDKDIVTEDDVQRVVCQNLEILSPDIAYAYRNNDKII